MIIDTVIWCNDDPRSGPLRGTAGGEVEIYRIAAGAPRRGGERLSYMGVWGSKTPIIIHERHVFHGEIRFSMIRFLVSDFWRVPILYLKRGDAT